MLDIDETKRPADFLKPIKGDLPARKKLVVFDFETKDGRTQRAGFTRPFLIGLHDGAEYIPFRPPRTRAKGPPRKGEHLDDGGIVDVFMRALLVERFSEAHAKIYAHNGGRFDVLFLLPWLRRHRGKYKFALISAQSRVQKVTITDRTTGVSWGIYDSVALIPLTLSKMGKTFAGLDKTPDFDLNEHEDHPDWEKYNEQDCVVLLRSLEAFHNLIESLGGEIGLTAPATSMKLFRRRYQRRWIKTNRHWSSCAGKCLGCKRLACDGQCHGCQHDFIREGYCGGRVEIYTRGGKTRRYYDINSSYPASMLEPMPIGEAHEEHGGKFAELRAKHRGRAGFVECDVFIPRSVVVETGERLAVMPPLPLKHEGKLKFPVGRFSGVWSAEELDLLEHPMVQGKIERVRRSVWYDTAPVFQRFILSLYKYRDKKSPTWDAGLDYIAKLLMNSHYGKYGQREERTEIVLLAPGEPWPVDGWPVDGDFDSAVWERETVSAPAYIVPAIAAHITALSRVRFWHGAISVLKMGGIIDYGDTDALINTLLFDSSYELGGWKREYEDTEIDTEFLLPKNYRLTLHKPDCENDACLGCAMVTHAPECKGSCKGCSATVQRMKGIPGKLASSENFEKLRDGGEVQTKRIMQHKTILKLDRSGPEMVTVRKSIKGHYDKRRWLEDGTTIPIVLGMD